MNWLQILLCAALFVMSMVARIIEDAIGGSLGQAIPQT